MSTRFYLKRAVRPGKGTIKTALLVHMPTQLEVVSDFRGFFVQSEEDPYKTSNYSPRKDLRDDCDFFTCRLEVAESIYLGDIPRGKYESGDEKTTILVEGIIRSPEPYRQIMVTAPTWQRIIDAIAKIRAGEIRPTVGGQTMFEKLQSETAADKARDFEIIGDLMRKNALLKTEAERLASFVNMANYWSGGTEASDGQHTPDALAQIIRRLEEMHQRDIQYALLRDTRWYKIRKFFADFWADRDTDLNYTR